MGRGSPGSGTCRALALLRRRSGRNTASTSEAHFRPANIYRLTVPGSRFPYSISFVIGRSAPVARLDTRQLTDDLVVHPQPGAEALQRDVLVDPVHGCQLRFGNHARI